MVEYIDRYVFYMSYQNCYVLFNIQKTLFKTEKSCTRSVNHHFRTDVSRRICCLVRQYKSHQTHQTNLVKFASVW